MNIFYNILNIYLLHDNLRNFNMYNNQWFCTHFQFCSFDLYFHLYNFDLLFHYGCISRGCILNTSFFYCWNNLHLSLFMSSIWLFTFLTPSSEVLWFFCLYLHLSYSTFEIMWFLSLHFLFLSCSTRPCFSLLILTQYLCTCYIDVDKIWKLIICTSKFFHQLYVQLDYFPTFL